MNNQEIKQIKIQTIIDFRNYLREFRKNFSESFELSDAFHETNKAIDKFQEKLER